VRSACFTAMPTHKIATNLVGDRHHSAIGVAVATPAAISMAARRHPNVVVLTSRLVTPASMVIDVSKQHSRLDKGRPMKTGTLALPMLKRLNAPGTCLKTDVDGPTNTVALGNRGAILESLKIKQPLVTSAAV